MGSVASVPERQELPLQFDSFLITPRSKRQRDSSPPPVLSLLQVLSDSLGPVLSHRMTQPDNVLSTTDGRQHELVVSLNMNLCEILLTFLEGSLVPSAQALHGRINRLDGQKTGLGKILELLAEDRLGGSEVGLVTLQDRLVEEIGCDRSFCER